MQCNNGVKAETSNQDKLDLSLVKHMVNLHIGSFPKTQYL